MNKVLLYVVLLIIASACKDNNDVLDSKPKESYDLVLKNGGVIDLETGDIEVSNIYINNGKIIKISPSDEELTYTAREVKDIEGKYVLPGYWDNHVHFRGGDSLIKDNKKFLNLFLANGVTTVRDAGGDLAETVINWRDSINSKDLIGPKIFSSGPKIDGPDARWAGSLEVETIEDIKIALDSLRAMRVDFVKLYDSTISAEAYLNTIREADRLKLLISGHMPFSVTLDETIDAGLDAVEHLYYILKGCSSKEQSITQAIRNKEYGFWASMQQLTQTYNDSVAVKTFKKLSENDVYVVPTLHIGNVLSYLDEVDHTSDEYLKYMSDGIIKTYQGRIDSALNATDKAVKDRKYLNLFFKSLVLKLHTNEVNILAGSDSGAYNSYAYPGISLHKELEALVEAGLSPLQALRTSAYNGSKFLGKHGDYGTLSEGKMADLVILNADPTIDITQSNNIYMLVLNGAKVDTSSILNNL